MSRVLARTSMISDEQMLKAATRMMIDRITNIATRSTCSASNSEAFICRQSTTIPRLATLAASGASIWLTLSASTVCTSTMPTVSPSISNVWASSIGITTNALS